ncbi:hypothetical protein [Natrarchaeobius chitinivorans]|uniref:MYXO-CTERM domain-containing protein n=1 Tax=Natrarchaeobius chitinivorans TaxID=1679083 RepID=A0A3N6NZP2_NATCH|nr:hypothetical protein [Natrarchaeobius chitinivorans]RQG90469.1 hypothetical protein EA473_21145 [Natrarchaeobius chitinivorans]
MPETEQQDRTLSELIVKEAVEKGLDTPMRDSILEAVEEADGGGKRRQIPLAGAVFGLGAAVGYLAGRHGPDLEETPLEDIEEPEIIEDIAEEDDDGMIEIDDESDDADSSSILPKVLAVLGILAGVAILRRRLSGETDDEWEPIEEFEPATSVGSDEESEAEEAETEDEEAESEEMESESETEESDVEDE